MAKKTTKKKATKKVTTKVVTKKTVKKEVTAKKETPKVEKKTTHKNKKNNWKVITIVLSVLAIALIIINFFLIMESNVENTVEEKIVENNQGLTLTLIRDANCYICNDQEYTQNLKAKFFPNLTINILEKESSEAKQIYSQANSNVYPVLLFSKEITLEKNWESQLKPGFIEIQINGETYYKLNEDFIQTKKLVNDIELNSKNVQTNPNAKVSIIEITDLTNPYTALSHSNKEMEITFDIESKGFKPAFPSIYEEYKANSDVNFVFLNAKMNNVELYSPESHNALMCAFEQGSAFEYLNILMQERSTWINDSTQLTQLTSNLDLNTNEFESCIKEKKFSTQIESDNNLVESLGIKTLPTYIVNGQILSGAQDYNSLKALIQIELNK